jgi:cysteinyl-tRNA synthetase
LDQARLNKNYQLADEIRKKIQDAGFEVRTTKEGTTIQKVLA